MKQSSVDHTLQALLVEYQIHGAELAKRLELQDRHLTILQGFAVVVGGAVATLLSQDITPVLNRLPSNAKNILGIILLVALAIPLQFGTSMTASSYMFMILRRRMAEIETAVNAILKVPDLMRYERSVARNFFEQPKFSDHTTSPVLASAIATYSTLFLVIALLVAISSFLLPQKLALAYFATALYWYAFLLWKAVDTVGAEGQKELDSEYLKCARSDRTFAITPMFAAISTWVVVVFLLHWAVFGMPTPPLVRGGLFIVAYSFATGTVAFPLPSEAPVFFVRSLADVDVLLYAALGKALSATLLVYLSRSALIAWWPVRYNRLLDRLRLGIGGPGPWLLYFLCQAVPFFPMRTSTLALGSVTSGVLTTFAIGFLCACATIVRMLLVLVLVSYGIDAARVFSI